MSYLLDTNTVIDYVNNLLSEHATTILEASPAISFITRIEVLVWPKLRASDKAVYEKFIGASTVYGCNEAIILQTIAIRKQYKLKLPDAIIAATTIVHNLTLLTRNLKDFRGIANLTVVDPHTL